MNTRVKPALYGNMSHDGLRGHVFNRMTKSNANVTNIVQDKVTWKYTLSKSMTDIYSFKVNDH